MPITIAFSYLVSPGKGLDEQPSIASGLVALKGKLHAMLLGVFEKSQDECNVDITFSPNSQGQQQNDCRDLFLAFCDDSTEANGLRIAERLQGVTTRRSKLGLLFLMLGRHGNKNQLVISRFPADSGVLAETTAGALSVSFLERVFMKSATSYKSAVYSGALRSGDLWNGRAVDKQINDSDTAISDYWVRAFLLSDFRTTAAGGTRRLATALRSIAQTTSDLEIKEQVAAAAKLVKGMSGRRTSIKEFCSRLGLSDGVVLAMRKSLGSDRLFTETFQIDTEEFSRHLAYRSVELDTGAILTAGAAEFDKVFDRKTLPKQAVRFSAEGRIVDERLQKARR